MCVVGRMCTLTDEDYSTCFLEHFNQLYQEKKMCDITLHTKDGHTLLCHRIVLVSFCSKLKTQLDKEDINTSLLLMLDASSSCLKDLVDFMYTGKLLIKGGLEAELLNTARYLGATRAIQIMGVAPTMAALFASEFGGVSDHNFISDNRLKPYFETKKVSSSPESLKRNIELGTSTLASFNNDLSLQESFVMAESPPEEPSDCSMNILDDHEDDIAETPADLVPDISETNDQNTETNQPSELLENQFYQTLADPETQTVKVSTCPIVQLDDIQMLEQQVHSTLQCQSTAVTVQSLNKKSECEESYSAASLLEDINQNSTSKELITPENNLTVNDVSCQSDTNVERINERSSSKRKSRTLDTSSSAMRINDESSTDITPQHSFAQRETESGNGTFVIQHNSLSDTALNEIVTKVVSSKHNPSNTATQKSQISTKKSVIISKQTVNSGSTVSDQSVILERCRKSQKSLLSGQIVSSSLEESEDLSVSVLKSNDAFHNYSRGDSKDRISQQNSVNKETLNPAVESSVHKSERNRNQTLEAPFDCNPASLNQNTINRKNEKNTVVCIREVSASRKNISPCQSSQSRSQRYHYAADTNSSFKLPPNGGTDIVAKDGSGSDRSPKTLNKKVASESLLKEDTVSGTPDTKKSKGRTKVIKTSVSSVKPQKDPVIVIRNAKQMPNSADESKMESLDIQSSPNGSSDTMKEKIVDSQKKKNVQFKCRRCKEPFPSRNIRNEHSQQCTGKKRKCLLTMVEKFKTPDGYFCERCGYKTWKAKNFQNHRYLHNLKRLQCPHCSCIYVHQSQLDWHIQNVHVNPISCQHCGKRYRTITGLKRHVKGHEKNREKNEIKLSVKSSAFKSAEDLLAEGIQTLSGQISGLMNKNDKEANAQTLEYCCTICDYQTRSTELYNRHQKMHSNGSYKCSQCSKQFLTLQGLSKHLEIHTGSLRCPKCLKTVKSKRTLSRHINEGCLYKCELCEYLTDDRQKLKYHRIKHDGDFECSLCSRSYAEERKLKDHIKLCHIKPHVCKECNKSFSTNSGYTNHVNIIHGNPEKLPCKYCNKTFRHKNNLIAHLNTHEKSKLYRCGVCGKDFVWRSVLYRHMKKCSEKKPKTEK